ILAGMSSLIGKPPAYYVNYSFALLQTGQIADAAKVCECGLHYFPEDVGIIGNHTIALRQLGDMPSALNSALLRLKIRRDVEGLEEASHVLRSTAKRELITDLPNSLKKVQMALDLLNEALRINPASEVLKLNKAQTMRTMGQDVAAAQMCKALIDSDASHPTVKQSAFLTMVELLIDMKDVGGALKLIQDHANNCSNTQIGKKLRYLEHKILADHFMIGKMTSDGKRTLVREPTEFFLRESFTDGKYQHPIDAARILDWMNRRNEAIHAVQQDLDDNQQSWEAYSCMAQFLCRWNNHTEAITWADGLVAIGPWKAESYDIASFVYKQAGDTTKAEELKIEGDRVFSEEIRLRKEAEQRVN
ncbi:MAG: hypothetical protein WCI20_12240, partial [bacterium]